MLDELITGRYPLERINEAIASSRSGAALRNATVFRGAAAPLIGGPAVKKRPHSWARGGVLRFTATVAHASISL